MVDKQLFDSFCCLSSRQVKYEKDAGTGEKRAFATLLQCLALDDPSENFPRIGRGP